MVWIPGAPLAAARMMVAQLLLVLAVRAESTPLSPFMSPTRVTRTGSTAFVKACPNVNLTLVPTVFAFHDEGVEQMNCDDGHSVELELLQLANLLQQETPADYWHLPTGFIVHAARVGSTAAANMVGAHKDVVVLKEAGAVTDILMWALPSLSGRRRQRREQQQLRQLAVRALQVVVQLFFRSSASQRLSEFSRNSVPNANELAGRTRLVFKLASAGSASAEQLSLLRAAFPDAPIGYMVRDPVASVASLLAAPQQAHEMLTSPCLRWRGRLARAQLPVTLQLANATDPLKLTMEQYCAAHIGALHTAMSRQIEADGGLADARR